MSKPGPKSNWNPKTPRTKGIILQITYQLTRIPWMAKLMCWLIKKKFHFKETLLGISPQTEMEIEPHPLQSAPPRRWHDAQLGDLPVVRGSAAELRNAYKTGKTTPGQVLETLITRVDSGNFGLATYSPFVCADWDRAREEALKSTERYQNGSSIGPLDGIPVPIKDNLDVAGLPNRVGTSYLNTPVKKDSFGVQALVNAGAIIAGKTHATEWLMNGWGMNHHFDMPRNVWCSEHGAGGSSTGSAVAVALGLSPVAVGSDGGGSIRMPAAFNGVFGLKPTFIRISRTGDMLRACSMCHTGPLGRCTEDLVDLMEVMGANPDPEDSLTSLGPSGTEVVDTWRSALGRGVKGCRIGVLQSEINEAQPSHAEACRKALAALASEGAELVDVEIPMAKYVSAIGGFNIFPEVLAALNTDKNTHRLDLGLDLRLLINILSHLSLNDYLMIRRARRELRLQVQAVLKEVDVIMLPTLIGPPIPYSLKEGRIDISDPDANPYCTRLTIMSNITGLPAGTVPIGMHEGFPVNVQIIGDAWDEASVFAIMAHLERIGVAKTDKCPGFESLAASYEKE